jgi:HEAT repeat protein
MAKSIALLTFAALLTQGLPALAQFDTLVPLPTPIPSSTPSLDLDGPPILPRRSLPAPAKTQGPFSLPDRLNELRTANTSLRYGIIKELSDPKRNVVPALIAALKTESDPLVKSALAEVLATRWEEATPAIDSLVAMLADKRRALVPGNDYPRAPEPSHIPPPFSINSNVPVKRIPSKPPGNPGNLLSISAIEALGNIGLPAREKAMRPLTALLQDENPLVQVNAVWALLEIGADVPVLETWLSVLQSSDSEARQVAARLARDNDSLLQKAFGSEATQKTIKQLVSVLGDSEGEVRAASRSSLRLFGKQVIPDLTLALESPNALTRLYAAQLLGNFGADASYATSALIKRLSDFGEYNPPLRSNILFLLPATSIRFIDPRPTADDRFVRTNAALALGSIGSTEAIPALQLGLKDPNPKMRLASAWALTQLNRTEIAIPVLGELSNNRDSYIRSDSLRILKTLTAKGLAAQYILPALLKQFDAAKPEYREQVLSLDLGAIALPGVSRLREALEGPDIAARGYAVTVLANIYEDLARQNTSGELSKNDRTLATQELTKILAIVTKPGAKFNKTPIDRLRNLKTRF